MTTPIIDEELEKARDKELSEGLFAYRLLMMNQTIVNFDLYKAGADWQREKMQAEIDKLKEYKWKYEELCK